MTFQFKLTEALGDKVRVFLDDERPMPEEFDVNIKRAPDLIELLKKNIVSYISFDHDLGPDAGTGYDVAKWIEEMAYYGKLGPIDWDVHSANPVGKKNIESAMKNAEIYWQRRLQLGGIGG